MAEALVTEKVVRIGGATASFSDTALSVPQLLAKGELDYLIFDYLAEGSMGIFGRMQSADPAAGYGTDFLTVHVGPYLSDIASQGIKVVANAGGVNPAGLAAALEDLIAENGLDLTVAYVAGDDLRGREAELRAAGHRDIGRQRQAVVGHPDLQSCVLGPAVEIQAHIDPVAEGQGPVQHRVDKGVRHGGVDQHLDRLELAAQRDAQNAQLLLALLQHAFHQHRHVHLLVGLPDAPAVEAGDLLSADAGQFDAFGRNAQRAVLHLADATAR